MASVCTRWLVGVGAEAPLAAWEKTLEDDDDDDDDDDASLPCELFQRTP